MNVLVLLSTLLFDLMNPAGFADGLAVRGRYLQGLDPVAGARVGVVPAGLHTPQPFLLPLGVGADVVLRLDVETDVAGEFELPELAPGDYFLETLLPTGRLHRTEVFHVPEPPAGTDEPRPLDLGTIQVPDGLSLAVRVTDDLGQAIAGAKVAARQGESVRELTSFEATSDAEGVARLRGLTAEMPVHLRCLKDGFEPWQQTYELLPVEQTCVLERPVSVVAPPLFGRPLDGVVVDAGTGEPVAAVTVTSVSPPGAADDISGLDGTFQLTMPEDRPVVLRFEVPDYARRELTLDVAEAARLRATKDPLRVELTPAGWILAVVTTAGGTPCRGCRLRVWPGGEEIVTDSLGEALSGPLAPGTYRVGRTRVDHLGSTVVETDDAELRWADVDAGIVTRVRFREADATLRVRLEPVPAGRFRLGVQSADFGPRFDERHEPEADGTYVIGRRGRPVDLFLYDWDAASQGERAVWQATLPGRPSHEEIRVRLSRSTLRARVRSTAGREPQAGRIVRLRRFVDGALHGWTTTAADGSFELPNVQPGVYSLYVGDLNLRFVSVSERQTVDLGWIDLPVF